MADVDPAGTSSSVGVGEPSVPTKYIDNEQVVTTAGTVQRQRVVNPNADELLLAILVSLNELTARKGFPDASGNDRVAVQGTVPVSGSLTTAGTVSTVTTVTTVSTVSTITNIPQIGSFLTNGDQVAMWNIPAQQQIVNLILRTP